VYEVGLLEPDNSTPRDNVDFCNPTLDVNVTVPPRRERFMLVKNPDQAGEELVHYLVEVAPSVHTTMCPAVGFDCSGGFLPAVNP
jgi:hypothetical protein